MVDFKLGEMEEVRQRPLKRRSVISCESYEREEWVRGGKEKLIKGIGHSSEECVVWK